MITKRIKCLVVLMFASFDTTFAQQAVPDPSKRPPPPKIDLRIVEQEKRRLFSGLDSRIAYEIRARIRGSMIEVFSLFGTRWPEVLRLDAQQQRELSQALAERKLAREEILQSWYINIQDKKEINEKDLNEAVSDILAKEQKREEAFASKLSTILNPDQCSTLCKAAMGDLRAEFARVPFVAKHLVLTPKQVSLYEKCRMANDHLLKKEAEFLKSAGLPANELDTNKKAELVKLQTELVQTLSRLTIEADNALSSEQFLFVARSIGFVKANESLEEFFWKQDLQIQDDLCAKLVHFKRIKDAKR